MTRDANKITRLKINHNASKQEFQEQEDAQDFWKIKWYFENFCETHEQLGKSGYSISVRNYP